MRAIIVKRIDIKWLMQSGGKFLDLPPILNETDNESIFQTEFVKKVLEEFWEDQYKKLLRWHFIPYTGCLLLTCFQMHEALSNVNEDERED